MIWYGGIELSNRAAMSPDVQVHIERFIALTDAREFYRSSWPQGLSPQDSFNIPADDWPYHLIKLDSLFWPVGASSWAVGHYLVTDSTLAQIRAQAYAGETLNALPLRMDDARGGIVTTDLFMLPARPVVQIPNCQGVYLLTLVDERYNWRNLNIDLQIASSTTWTQVINALQDEVTFTFDAPNALYLKPSTALTGTFRSVPALMDAVAYSLGMRVVRKLDGTVKMMNVSTSRTRFDALYAANTGRIAGGRFALSNAVDNDLDSELPQSVSVRFPVVNTTTHTSFEHSVTLVNLALTEYAGVSGSSTIRSFSSTAAADFAADHFLPDNFATLRNLVKQIATDYYRWRSPGLDLVLGGSVPWDGEAHTFMTEWCHSLLDNKIYTRLQRGRDDASQLYHAGASELPSETAQVYLVQMLQDAVPDNHPEFPIGGPFNAVVQEWNPGTADWEAGQLELWVTCLDRLPLREGDRFWVELHDSGKWVPTYEPRSAGVRVENLTPDDEGLYYGFVRVFDDVLVTETDGAPCRVYDSNGNGLDEGIYAGCDLIGHRNGVCVYRATCCTGTLISGSGSSGSDASGSQSGCGCVPEACAGCAPYTMSKQYRLEVSNLSAGTDCQPFFNTAFILNFVGNCTWKTSSTVNQLAFTNGTVGPTWELTVVAGQLHLKAAGKDVGVVGSFTNGCSGPIRFNLNHWVWDSNRACSVPIGRIVLVPLCSCPSGSGAVTGSGSSSGSTCAKICEPCAVTHCQFKVNLQGFGADLQCTESCVDTPYLWLADFIDSDGTTFAGTLVEYGSGASLLNVGGCVWDRPAPGGILYHLHTSGISTIALTLFGAAGGQMNYAGLIDAEDCCKNITLYRTSSIPLGASAPETIIIQPQCGPTPPDPCLEFNVGDLVLTYLGGDCYWSGDSGNVHGTLLFDAISWTLTLTTPERTAIYRGYNANCCGSQDLTIESSDCFAPTDLTLAPVTPCDNCCTNQAQWYCMEAHTSVDLIQGCCPNPNGTPSTFPRTVLVDVSHCQYAGCVPDGTYTYVYRGDDPAWTDYHGLCLWTWENDTPDRLVMPWFFSKGAHWEFKFNDFALNCPQGPTAPNDPFDTSHDCEAMTIHLSLADSGNNMQLDIAPASPVSSGSGAGTVQCLQLTAAQLAAMTADGWIEAGGPYASQTLCELSCQPSGSGSGATAGETVCATCGECVGQMPRQWALTISGLTDPGTCPECVAQINGTFILSYEPGYATCAWRSDFVDPGGVGCTFNTRWLLQNTGAGVWDLLLNSEGFGSFLGFHADDEDFDCCGESAAGFSPDLAFTTCGYGAVASLVPLVECSPVCVSCCPLNLPSVLQLHLIHGTFGDGNLAGDYLLTWDDGLGGWVSDTIGGVNSFFMYCLEGDTSMAGIKMKHYCDGVLFVDVPENHPETATCDPFYALWQGLFSLAEHGDCGDRSGAYDVTVTEL